MSSRPWIAPISVPASGLAARSRFTPMRRAEQAPQQLPGRRRLQPMIIQYDFNTSKDSFAGVLEVELNYASPR